MSETVIKVENISKFYQLGLINHGTLAKDLQGWWAKIRGKEDPNSRISLVSNKNTDFIYALKDVSFDVKQGEVLGIIGANGAGKSTLLKILSRVTSPTSGCIKIKGRIGSLLEVGTGFHPELTGRENIYLNGAILGMRKHEIDKKLDEIIDFSGVEKFIDTPVKRYSSGMYVRLAFAVAAHLDPEILVVDEVLAVGDADFQKKCLGKMDDVSKKEGRTVLFVSHNMAAVRQLCTRGILLELGKIKENGHVDDVIDSYLKCDCFYVGLIRDKILWHDECITIEEIKINGTSNHISNILCNQQYLSIEINGYANKAIDTEVSVIFRNEDGGALASFSYSSNKGELLQFKNIFKFKTNIHLPNKLYAGKLFLDLYFHKPKAAFYMKAPRCCVLDCEGFQNPFGQVILQKRAGLMELTSVD